MSGKTQEKDQEMNFWGHLEALRWTLVHIAIAFAILVVASFAAMPYLFDSFVLAPTTSDFFLYKALSGLSGRFPFLPDFGNEYFHVEIININVASQFTTHISTSCYLALVILFPYAIYEIWKFIKPALYSNEIRNMRLAFILGTVMFFLGCTVGYTIVFPFTFRFLAEYSISESIVNQISLNSYISNFTLMIFVMGVVFELPLLAWLLSKMGLVNKPLLKKYRRYAVVILLVLSAIITPSGDPFTLAVVFLPLYLLYEFSILLVRKG